MRLFKFTSGPGAIELTETVGFDDEGYRFNFSNQVSETVGFNEDSSWADIYDVITEEVGFSEAVDTFADIKVFITEVVGFIEDGSVFDFQEVEIETVGFNEVGLGNIILSNSADETVGFNDTINVIAGLYVEINETVAFNDESEMYGLLEVLTEDVGFNESLGNDIWEHISATAGFGDSLVLDGFESLEDTVGFQDEPYEDGTSDQFETVGFDDELVVDLFTFDFGEDLEFRDYAYIHKIEEYNFVFKWKAAYNLSQHPYGFGASIYGDNVSYGDDPSSSDLAYYSIIMGDVVHPGLRPYPSADYYRCLRVHRQVTISDSGDPDAYATYTLTPTDNKLMNDFGIFFHSFWVEVFVRDTSGRWSLCDYKYIDNTHRYNWSTPLDEGARSMTAIEYEVTILEADTIWEMVPAWLDRPPMAAS